MFGNLKGESFFGATLVLEQKAGRTEQFDLFLVCERYNCFVALAGDDKILASYGSYRVNLGAFPEIGLDFGDRTTGTRGLVDQALYRKVFGNRREDLQPDHDREGQQTTHNQQADQTHAGLLVPNSADLDVRCVFH